MVTLYIGSSDTYSGKTLTGMVLGLRYQEQGRRVGYFKPFGLVPHPVGAAATDEDAEFVAGVLHLPDRLEDLCPLLLTPEVLRRAMQESAGKNEAIVRDAFARLARDRDIMLVGGSGSVLSRGALIGLRGPRVAELFDARVLLISKLHSYLDVDALIAAQEQFGGRLAATLLNNIPTQHMDHVRGTAVPFLNSRGFHVIGALPNDPVLNSVSIRELTDHLAASVLCGEDHLDELVEEFSVGAMNVESALRYFRRVGRKCVITGGDRSDIQIAALETPTKCLILTGDLQPSSTVLARARAAGVPTLLVREDTLSTVERLERLLGRLRVREPKKIQRARELFAEHVDLDALDAAIGLTH
jgi:hypothetical protein